MYIDYEQLCTVQLGFTESNIQSLIILKSGLQHMTTFLGYINLFNKVIQEICDYLWYLILIHCLDSRQQGCGRRQ